MSKFKLKPPRTRSRPKGKPGAGPQATGQQRAPCPSCGAMLAINQQGVQDVVCQWSNSPMSDERPKIAGITPDGALVLKLTTIDGRKPMLSIPLGDVVPTALGLQQFKLEEIHPGVLKLYPSIADPQIHAYITIVGVPEDWKQNA